MREDGFTAPAFTDAEAAEIARYRAVSKLAVASLILGLVSFVAVFEPFLYLVPVAGVAVGAAALAAIARNDGLLGRGAAVAGLLLSLLFAAAAPAHWITFRQLLQREARHFARAWFERLREGEPHKAFELTRHPEHRNALGDALWKVYAHSPHLREELENYVAPAQYPDEPPRLVRTLLALGEQARPRYFSTDAQGRIDGVETLYQVYAVTYPEGGEEKTFFVGLEMKRYLVPPDGTASWRLVGARGGVRPAAFGPAGEEQGR